MRSLGKRRHARQFLRPEERERIIARRAQLMLAQIETLVLASSDEQAADVRRNALARDYGVAEVQRMLGRLARQFNRPRDPDLEKAWLYTEYVALHRRFGGTRPLLSAEEQRALNFERTLLKARQQFKGELLSADEQHRLAEISDLLLADSDLWDDLIPENPPPTLQSPTVRPGRNDPCWCGSGRKYKHCHLRADEEAQRQSRTSSDQAQQPER